MPTAIHGEDFDASSSLPTGWNWSGEYTIASGPPFPTGITPVSASRMLAVLASSAMSKWGTYATADGAGGVVSVGCYFNALTTSGTVAAGVHFRGVEAAPGIGGGTRYLVEWSPSAPSLALNRLNSGTPTQLGATVTPSSVAVPGWYLVIGSGDATNVISASVQRYSDGHWLASDGSWQSAQQAAISVTDSSPITGSGYAGVYVDSASDHTYADNFELDSLAPSGAAGTIGPTESRDSGSLSGRTIVAMMAKTEAHDVGSLAGVFAAPGGLTATEHRDAASLAGVSSAARLAATERGDSGALGGNTPNAIFDWQEAGDAGALAGRLGSPAGLAATESRDPVMLAGFFPAARLAATERGDSGAIAATSKSAGTLAATERRDGGSLAGSSHPDDTLAAREGRDGGAFSGSLAHGILLAATERRDVGDIAARSSSATVLAAREAGDVGSIRSVALGIPPSFRVREAGDVGALLGDGTGLRYDVYRSPLPGQPVNYDVPVAITPALTWSSGPLEFPGTWTFGVRAADANGEEQNVDCVVTVVLDAAGRDVTNRPAAPMGLRAIPLAGGRLKVEWACLPVVGPKQPTGFHVYCTPVGDVAP